ncbi:MAG: phenylalanine--tRNA ligase subunit beta [Candidatus Saccharimonadales bacterium]
MKISLNWVKQFVDVDIPVDQLIEVIGARLGAVESVVNLGERYQGIVVAKVITCENHPDADKLHVCLIDDNQKAENVERDNEGLVRVVCGAQNVHAGMYVAWLPPGTTVPESYAKEPYVIEVRNIRGQKSNGMLASPKELALGDNREGILEIDCQSSPGDDFAVLYELNDYIIELENKMLTHRPDCFGQLGIAREIAGILGKQFISPPWYKTNAPMISSGNTGLPLEVRNELPELVPRFMVVVVNGIKINPLSILLQSYLSRLGVHPVNNVVDITNYLMMLTGQPMHAYDYDKVKALNSDHKARLVVRFPKNGERLSLLSGKEIELSGETILIATDQKIIGLGGVMGGTDSEVDDQTERIILECASFDMYSIRRTAMAYGLFTDAVTRFTKGQSPLQNDRVLKQALELLGKYASGKQASDVIDDNQLHDRQWVHPPVSVSPQFINSRLGLQLDAGGMKKLLENVECSVVEQNQNLVVTAPFWRTDIEIREDVVEEVGRLDGYDKLPMELPKRSLTPAPKDELLELKNKIRRNLSKTGANEVLTYSFVRASLIDQVGQDKTLAFQLSNALSPDLQYYRLSLTPSLLDKVFLNIKSGYGRFALFEIGKSHALNESYPDEPGIPKEVDTLSLVYADNKNSKGVAYYEARAYLLNLLEEYQVDVNIRFDLFSEVDLGSNPRIQQLAAPFEPNRSAVLRDKDGLIWGVVGEFKAAVKRSLKLPALCAGFEFDLLLLAGGEQKSNYLALPRFPKVEQDICLKVTATMTYQQLFDFIRQRLVELKPDQTRASLSAIDIYERPDDSAHKQVTFRLNIASYDRTMTDIEVNTLLDQLAEAAKKQFQAERL